MARARGANAVLNGAFETTYGTPAAAAYFALPFVSNELGETQGLLASDLLGQGREPLTPTLDVADDSGNVIVPVDARNFGFWLKLLLGSAASDTQGSAAAGSYAFSAQPANNATVTIGGTVVTFVTATPTGAQVKIGADLATTLTSLVQFLNGSADVNLVQASYALGMDNASITVTFKTIGTGGNAFTIAASSSPASNATPSGATLAGGVTTGNYNHVWHSGAASLPSATLEMGNPDVPSYGANFGAMVDSMEIALQRSGLLNATVSVVAQGENLAGSSIAGTPTVLAVQRFAQANGKISRLGAPLGDVVSASLKIGNGLDKVQVIRQDGRIAGADPGAMDFSGQVVVRFKDTTMLTLASNNTPIDLTFGWTIPGTSFALVFRFEKVLLPKPKRPITGPTGIQATFAFQGAKSDTLGWGVTATLVNDVASY